MKHPNVESLSVDLLDPTAARQLIRDTRPTHLLHIAWTATPGKFWIDPRNVDWCESSLTLFREFAAYGGHRAVFAGTCAEYAWEDETLNESSTSTSPATLYGIAKDSLRRLLLAAAPLYGVSLAWGRIFWLYGPHEPSGRLVSDVARAISQGKTAETTEGRQARDFLHVSDVAGAFVAALSSDFEGVFNIGSGEAVPVRDIVTSLAEALGRPDLLRLGAMSAAANERPSLKADVRVLASAIKFRQRIELADGLRDTANWWRENASS